MAKRSGSRNDNDNPNRYDLVQVRFNDRQRVEINHWIEARKVDLTDWLNGAAERGWKISFSWSGHYDCFFLTLTPKAVIDLDPKVSYSLRHSDVDKLLGIGQYFTDVLGERGEIANMDRRGDTDW